MYPEDEIGNTKVESAANCKVGRARKETLKHGMEHETASYRRFDDHKLW